VIGYAAPFDQVRIHGGLKNYPLVVEDVKGSLVVGVVDLNIDRVGSERKSLKVVIYLPMSGTKTKGLSPSTRTGIL
jgi:hypothetical protein